MEIIGIFVISSVALADTTPAFLLCEKLLNQRAEITAIDMLLIKKSRYAPVASGHAVAPAGGDLVNRWYAYFVCEEHDCFASPTATMDNLTSRLNRIVQKQADMGHYLNPVQIFFMGSNANYSLSNPTGSQFPVSNVYSRNQNLSYGMQMSLGLRTTDKPIPSNYHFHEPSSVVFIGAGDNWNPSHWSDDFTLAKELSSLVWMSHDLPKYYREGLSSFRAYQLTGLTKPGIENDMNIAKPHYDSIYSMFEDGHQTVNNFQIGVLYANFFYKLWRQMSALDLQPEDMEKIIERVQNLLNNAYISKTNNTIKRYKFLTTFSERHAQDVFNFLAATSIQASVEQNLPFELTEWLCEEWNFFGVQGPFSRHRIYNESDVTGRKLIPYEEQFHSLIFPDRWKNCDELYATVRPRHLPRHQ